MNISPVAFPLRFASPAQPTQDASKAQWVPAVKGYSSHPPQAFEPDPVGGPRTPAVGRGRTRGPTTQFGGRTDPGRLDLDLYG